MATRRLFLAARVARPALDGWLPETAVLVAGGPDRGHRCAGRAAFRRGRTHEVHDLGSVSLLPGFVETHVHMHYPSSLDYRDIARPEPVERMLIRATANMRRLLISGATTARDTGSRDEVALAIRSAIRDGVTAGPRLLVAGAPITTTAGHYWFLGAEADTTDEVVRRVRERRGLGVDVVKIIASGGGYTPTSNPRSQQYGLETHAGGRRRGASPGAARPGPFADRRKQPDLRRGRAWTRSSTAASGGRSIRSATWRTTTTRRSPTRIAERGIWVDPTIGEVELHREHHDAGLPDKPEFEHWALPDVPSELEPRLEFMRDMADRGVRFIGGMGMGMPIVTFDSVACSAQVYARLLGFEPWRAIASITLDAAEALGLAGTIGAIRPGWWPISSRWMATRSRTCPPLRRPRDVIQGGRPVVRDGRALV